MVIGNKEEAVIILLHFDKVLYRSIIVSKVQFSGAPDAAYSSFHTTAKVSIFSIFDLDEEIFESHAPLLLHGCGGCFICDFISAVLLFYAEGRTLPQVEPLTSVLGQNQLITLRNPISLHLRIAT